MHTALVMVAIVLSQAGSAEQQIDDLRQAFVRAYEAGDAGGIALLFTEDGVLLPPGEWPVSGREAIRARYATQFRQARSSFALGRTELVVDGKLGYLRGTLERTDHPRTGGEPRRYNGEYLMVFTRGDDGWRISRDMWTVRAPPTQKPTVSLDVPVTEFKSLVEARLGSTADLLQLVASSAEAGTGSWQLIEPRLQQIAKLQPEAEAVWFARPDGTYWTVEKGATGQSLRDRSYFPTLLAGEPVEGALVISRSTGARSIIVAQPIRRDGKVIGAVGTSLSVGALSRSLDAQLRLPDDMVFYALDANGQTALHRDPELLFEYPSDLGGPSLKTSVKQMLSRDRGEVHYEFRGVPKTVHFERSKPLGWVFAIGSNDPAPPRGVGGAGPHR